MCMILNDLRSSATILMKTSDLVISGVERRSAGVGLQPCIPPKEKIKNTTNKAVRLLKTLKSEFFERGKAVRLLKTSLLWV